MYVIVEEQQDNSDEEVTLDWIMTVILHDLKGN